MDSSMASPPGGGPASGPGGSCVMVPWVLMRVLLSPPV